MTLPLAGVTVLDMSSVLAGPVTATFLGDFGADVVKVEEPGRGDFTRGLEAPGRSAHWAQEARNKRSITCNLRTPQGQDLLRRIVPFFDVVVLNTRPPTLDRWELSPDRLQELSPRTVIACLTAYGLTGPYRDRGAFDRIASSFSGLTHVTGYPEHEPVRSGYAVIDYMSAYLAAFGVMVALYHRDVHGGTGQIVDLALYEAGFRASEDSLVRYATTGAVRERTGNINHRIVPATEFVTRDSRRVSVHAGTDPLFARLSALIGMPQLASDPRFATRATRVEYQAELYPILVAWCAERTADEITSLCSAVGIPASPVMSVADIAADPHYRQRGTIVDVADQDFGSLPMPGVMPRLTATPGSIRSTGPDLGTANKEIYIDRLGLTADDLATLETDGII